MRQNFSFKSLLLTLVLPVVAVAIGLVALKGNLDIRNRASGGSYPPNSIIVDPSQKLNSIAHTSTGFLLTGTDPSNDVTDLAPLKPVIYRSQDPQLFSNTNYQRFKTQGAQVQYLIYADYFGTYAVKGTWSGDNTNWNTWTKAVTTAVNQAKSANQQVEYEIWNEPDTTNFWGRSQAQFFATWKQAYQTIKALNPNAVIIGPSLGSYNPTYLESFLTYAKANNVLPSVLTWHELDGSVNPPDIVQHVNTIKSWATTNKITLPSISINEILQPTQTNSPGDTAQYLAALEYAKVSGSRACWNEANGTSNCFNYTLDGLLTPDTKQTRSTWWVYQAYAGMQGTLVTVTPTSDTYGLATTTTSPTPKIQILLGKKKTAPASATSTYVAIPNLSSVPGLVKNNRVHLNLQKIPNSDVNALTKLPAPTSIDANVTNDQALVVLDQLAATNVHKKIA